MQIMNNSNIIFKWALLPLIIFFILKNWINCFIIKNITPFLALLFNDSVIAIISLCVFNLILFINPVRKIICNNTKINFKYALLYTLYFFFTSYIIYISSYECKKDCLNKDQAFILIIGILSTAFLILITSIIIYSIFHYNKRNQETATNGGFLPDVAKYNFSNNNYQYQDINTSLINYIDKTSLKDSAHTIGIVAPWGYGKTSFINYFVHNKDNQNKYEIIHINIWDSQDYTGIINTFFQKLIDSLEPFSFGINNPLHQYVNILLKDNQNNYINFFRNFILNTLSNSNDSNQLKEEINNLIISTNKKYIVCIDDLDRLNKEELFNALKLIRNNFDFKNFIFLLAYDKGYVNQQLQDFNQSNANYIDKVINTEIFLPRIDEKLLHNYFIEIFGMANILNINEIVEIFIKLKIFEDLLNNFRSIKKFYNSIIIKLGYAKKELIVKDYLLLCLLEIYYNDTFINVGNYKFVDSQNFSDNYKFIDLTRHEISTTEKSIIIELFPKYSQFTENELNIKFPIKSVARFSYFKFYFIGYNNLIPIDTYNMIIYNNTAFREFIEQNRNNHDRMFFLGNLIEREHVITQNDKFNTYILNIINYLNIKYDDFDHFSNDEPKPIIKRYTLDLSYIQNTILNHYINNPYVDIDNQINQLFFNNNNICFGKVKTLEIFINIYHNKSLIYKNSIKTFIENNFESLIQHNNYRSISQLYFFTRISFGRTSIDSIYANHLAHNPLFALFTILDFSLNNYATIRNNYIKSFKEFFNTNIIDILTQDNDVYNFYINHIHEKDDFHKLPLNLFADIFGDNILDEFEW